MHYCFRATSSIPELGQTITIPTAPTLKKSGLDVHLCHKVRGIPWVKSFPQVWNIYLVTILGIRSRISFGSISKAILWTWKQTQLRRSNQDENITNRIDWKLHVATSLIAKYQLYPQGTYELGLSPSNRIHPWFAGDAGATPASLPKSTHVVSSLIAKYHFYPQGALIWGLSLFTNPPSNRRKCGCNSRLATS